MVMSIEASSDFCSGGRDLCHQDGKSPMGEPDEHTAAVSLRGAHATECLKNPVQWTVFNALRPTTWTQQRN